MHRITKQLSQLRFSVNPRLLLALLVIVLLSLLSIIQSGRLQWRNDKLILAVVSPLSGADAASGLEMVRSVQLYVDQINATGGVTGKPIELLTYDDQGDPAVARQIAEEIVEQPRVLAVIGHYGSATSQAVGEVYRTAKIPVVTGSATADMLTPDAPWYLRTIFNNRDQAIFLANYMKRVMGYSEAKIIYDRDLYGSTMAVPFEESFTGLGGRVTQKWSFDSADQQLPATLESIVQELTASKLKPTDILFLAAHGTEAVQLVIDLRRRGITNLIFGGDSLAGVSFAQSLNATPEQQAISGYFSDGIYATTPILFDLADNSAQAFQRAYIEAYQEEPTWVGATYYDAAQIIVEALQQVLSSGNQVAAVRPALRKQLLEFNSASNAFTGITGLLFFDAAGNSQQPPMVGIYQKGTLTAATLQLQPVPDIAQVPDFTEALSQGDILLVNSKYMFLTNVVYTGIDVNEVDNLAFDGGSYTVDFYIWFRAREGIDAANIEFLNYAVERLDSGERVQLSDPLVQKHENGMTYQAYRLKADFSSDFVFSDYPFDQQTLSIQFRHLTATRARLIYVVDQAGLGNTSHDSLLNKLEQSGAFEAVTDWYVSDVAFSQDVLLNTSTLGNPQLVAQEANIQYSRFNLVIDLRRNVLNFITRNLLPVFFIILLSYFSFYLPQIDFEALVPILTGTVLSIVFFHLDVSNDLGVSYTVMLDYVFYIMYAMFVFQLLLALIAWRAKTVQIQQAIMFVVKLSYPVVVVVTIGTFVIKYTDFWPNTLAKLWPDPQTATQQIVQAEPPTTDPSAQVTLRLGSWRLQDEAALKQVLATFHEQHPTITIQWEGSAPDSYSDVIARQLDKGVAPDLFYIPSFSGGQRLWAANYLAALDDMPALTQNFTSEELAPWATADGIPYGLPFIATAYGIYYNADLFRELDITPPTTWEALLQAAQTMQTAGHLPFANGIQEGWTVNEMIFMNLAPNFIGGQAGRLAYLAGERCFNDASSVAAFEALVSLTPFLPPDKEILNFADSRQLFIEGKAAMLMADSREIPMLEAGQPAFAWNVLAMPAPTGQPTVMTFVPSTALALSATSAHQEEAYTFLSWLATPEAEALIAEALPGLFTPHSNIPPSSNPRAQTFLTLLSQHDSDIGWAWQAVSNKIPAGYSLMQASAVAVIRGERTAQEAADDLQNGLANWFQPAQRCLLAQ